MTTFVLNGSTMRAQSSDDTPLLWVLRDELGLTGTKFGCGVGLCGACTVHLDGEPARACATPLSAAQGRRVTTIEGLGGPEGRHPVQRAWIAHEVPQCGYCQSGQIMAAAALLERHPAATSVQIDDAMSGNLCRCGTYGRMRAAIGELAGNKA